MSDYANNQYNQTAPYNPKNLTSRSPNVLSSIDDAFSGMFSSFYIKWLYRFNKPEASGFNDGRIKQ